MKTIITITLLLFALTGSAQKGYLSLALGFTPKENSGYFNGQVTAGTTILSNTAFIEYNQLFAISHSTDVPHFFQVRTGQNIYLDRDLIFRWFAGYSVTTVPHNSENRVGHSGTIGCYLVKVLDGDTHIKAELSVNNGFAFRPTVGVLTFF